MKSLVLLVLLCSVSLIPTTVLARRSGDLFTDRGNLFTNRPWVSGDPIHSDMFPRYANNFMRSDKDMFDRTQPVSRFYGGGDMFKPKHVHVPTDPFYAWNSKPTR